MEASFPMCCKEIQPYLLKGRPTSSGTVSQTLDLNTSSRQVDGIVDKTRPTVDLVDDTYDGRRVVAGRA